MYDTYLKLQNTQSSKYSYNPHLISTNENFTSFHISNLKSIRFMPRVTFRKPGFLNAKRCKNNLFMKYANESLVKSIRKIEDNYKDTNHKIKKIINDELVAVNPVNSETHSILHVIIFSGMCASLLSTYLVYYFTNR